ncbi:MAG: hypothetical protein AMXMBFR12_09210 [Candidatus Babeliales bacterium]
MNKYLLFCGAVLFFVLPLEGTFFRELLADFHPSVEKKIVIVITSYNNRNWYEYNLKSVLGQRYTNYRVIYIDDHSSDQTTEFVKTFVTQKNQWHRFTIIENATWESQMANHYKAVYMCDDDEIVVQIDGDDWFADDMVLNLLNKIYSYSDVWLTYGQFISWPQAEVGCSREIPEQVRASNAIREFGFCYSHPRTFYAWLFKKIKLKDLIYKGSFIPAAPTPDVLMMYPMIEMAGIHAQFIPDILYCWNRKNSLSQHNLPVKKEMPPAEKWQKYMPIFHKDNEITKARLNKKCGLFIWSYDEMQINDFIVCRLSNIQGISAVATSREINVSEFITQEALDYLLIIANPTMRIDDIDLNVCMYEMERTGAPLFFLGIHKQDFISCNEPIPYAPFKGAVMEYRLTPIAMNICAWQCDCVPELWHFDGLYTGILIDKNHIGSLDSVFKSQNFHSYKKCIQQIMKQPREIGLLFEQ